MYNRMSHRLLQRRDPHVLYILDVLVESVHALC